MKKEGVAPLTLNRPERLNALTLQMVEELLHAFQDVEQDEEVRVVVLTGAGRAFYAGGESQRRGLFREEPYAEMRVDQELSEGSSGHP